MAKSIEYVAAPAGMSGIYVEPWSKGEIYGVAANWAQASSPVLVYGDRGWNYDECGRQVADFRHSARAALRGIIVRAIEMGGDEADEEEVDGILDDATDLIDADVAEIAEILDSHGDRFGGNNVIDSANGWIEAGVTNPDVVDSWCEIGVWDCDKAADLIDADLTPDQVRTGADKLIEEAGDDCAEEYTDGCPIYSVCNNDTSIDVLIDAAKAD